MVMIDVVGVAMVMGDVRGSSQDPAEPIVRYLGQQEYFYTINFSATNFFITKFKIILSASNAFQGI